MARTLLTILMVATLLIAGVTPAAATFHADSPTPPLTQYSVDGQLQPSFVVEVEDGGLDKLKSWANTSTERRLISTDNASNTAVVAAPYLHVTGGLFHWTGSDLEIWTGTQLADRGYVTSVAVNYRLSFAEPVSVVNESAWSTPTVGLTGINDPAYPTEGVAFSEDTNRTTMAEARGYVGADNVSANTSGLTVAVIDTGANADAGRIFGNGTVGSEIRISNASASFLGSNVTTVEEAGWDAIADKNGHGSWTASAIAANPEGTVHDGLAPNATLLVLKALDKEGSGSAANIADAIRYAADHNASVISMSLGAPIRSPVIIDAVQYALVHGSVVVVAAGNSRATRSPGVATPADVAGVITVGATNGSEPSSAWSAYFSQYQGTQASDQNLTNPEPIDVVAPGMTVTARIVGTDGYVSNSTLSGTSMATPIVAGAIIQAMAANSTLAAMTPAEVHDAVTASAEPVPHMAVAEAGHGMIAADNLATGTHPETSQRESMTDPAQQRQQYYEAAASASGGWLAGVANRVSG